jgi:hypothetical protein
MDPLGNMLVFALWPGSVAAANRNQHGDDHGSWVEDDFCGSGVAVQHEYTESFTIQAVPDLDARSDVLTNPATGDTIVGTFAGMIRGQFAGDPNGLHTFAFSHAGLEEKIKAVNGPVLIVDAGHVVSVVTFDGDQFISEVNVTSGRHDELEDPDLFCAVATEALGIR